jgi:hypothetical protein
MKNLCAAAILAASMLGAPAMAQNVGDWVLSQSHGSVQYFPGVVAARDGNTVTVRFDDGTVERRPANLIRAFDWRAGSHVECRFTDGQWYGATITRLASDGLTVSVRYDDGDTQNTNTGRCRIPG